MYETHDSLRTSTSVRKAIPEDADVVRHIARRCGIDSWTVDQYREETKRTDAVFWVARRGPEVNGFISGRIVPSASDGMDGEIYNIAINPESRGQGIGRKLLEKAIKNFTGEGCNAVWLEVRESNRNAIQFYENNGFTHATIRRNFYTSPVENAIVMKLTLVSDS